MSFTRTVIPILKSIFQMWICLLPIHFGGLLMAHANTSVEINALQRQQPIHIVIDPGHGGTDNGAVYGGVREADLTLAVSKKLQQLLKNDFQVSMTRDADKTLPLQERLNSSPTKNIDLFISIHANATKDGRAKGVELFFQNQLPPDEDSQYLASIENQFQEQSQLQNANESLQPNKKAEVLAILEDLKRQNRIRESQRLSIAMAKQWPKINTHSIKQAPFYVISQNSVPSVLIEIGFLSHEKERKMLVSEAYQNEIARKIYAGVQSYLIKNSASAPLK